MQDKRPLAYSEITKLILGCCFDVMNELGSGFSESVYKNALIIAMTEKNLNVAAEQRLYHPEYPAVRDLAHPVSS